jgi:uncharacterized repeat protein (TIGR01451 family)
VLVPALTITKSADVSRIVAGGTVRYTITATNDGESNYPAAVLTDALADVRDDAVYNLDATATVGTLSYAGDTLGWGGALKVGESVLITYTVKVNVAASLDAVLVNTVSSTSAGSTCASTSTTPPCRSTVAVDAQVIALTDLTPSFTLTGLPGTTVAQDNAVTMTVTTNSATGYSVSVRSTQEALTPASPGNQDTIEIAKLGIRDGAHDGVRDTEIYLPMSTTAQTMHAQDGPSAPEGDAVTNDVRVEIPFVGSDTYSTTLEYIAVSQ